MGYKTLNETIQDLEKNGFVKRISSEKDPNLELASLHLEEFSSEKKVIVFDNVKGSKFKAVSNIFGTLERSKFLFRDSIEIVKSLIELKTNPLSAFKNPLKAFKTGLNAIYAIPKKVRFKNFVEVKISDLPQIKCWPDDGGSFITLPQVYSEDIENPGIFSSI